MPILTRRRLVKAMITLGVSGALFKYYQSFSRAKNLINFDPISNKIIDSDLELFTKLSKIVTLKDNLDKYATKLMFDSFINEPWGKEHILSSCNKINNYLLSSKEEKQIPQLNNSELEFSDGEKWFLSHLLTTWYLGVYYHSERPTKRIIYEEALMFDAIRGITPIPFLEPTGYGNWEELPEGLD